MMGSRLEVRSVLGKGSTFSFSLPQKVVNWEGVGDIATALKRMEGKRIRQNTGFVAPTARILVVDDAPMNIAVISSLLRRTKIFVDTASNGEECVEKFGSNQYDLVFLDHRMPGMDGMETLGELKRLYPGKVKDTPIISLTANAVFGAKEDEPAPHEYLPFPPTLHPEVSLGSFFCMRKGAAVRELRATAPLPYPFYKTSKKSFDSASSAISTFSPAPASSRSSCVFRTETTGNSVPKCPASMTWIPISAACWAS